LSGPVGTGWEGMEPIAVVGYRGSDPVWDGVAEMLPDVFIDKLVRPTPATTGLTFSKVGFNKKCRTPEEVRH